MIILTTKNLMKLNHKVLTTNNYLDVGNIIKNSEYENSKNNIYIERRQYSSDMFSLDMYDSVTIKYKHKTVAHSYGLIMRWGKVEKHLKKEIKNILRKLVKDSIYENRIEKYIKA